MFEKALSRIMLGAKTPEGKVIAILLTISLALMCWNATSISSAFAADQEDALVANDVPAEAVEVDQDQPPATDEAAADEAVEAEAVVEVAVEEPAAQDVVEAEPEEDAVEAEPEDDADEDEVDGAEVADPKADNATNMPAEEGEASKPDSEGSSSAAAAGNKDKVDASNSSSAAATQDVDNPKSESQNAADPKSKSQSAAAPKATAQDAKPAYPAVTLTKAAAGVSVTVSAEEGVLPEGVQLSVRSVYSSAVDNVVEAEVAADGNSIVDSVTLDVTLHDAKGAEIEPNGDVLVTFSNTALEGEGDVSVYRVADDASSVTEMSVVEADANEQTIVTDHFTIYKVVLKNGNTDIQDETNRDFQNITDATRTMTVGEVIYLYEGNDGSGQSNSERRARQYFSVSPSTGLTISETGAIYTAQSWYPYIQLTGVAPGTYTVTYDRHGTVTDSVTIIVVAAADAVFYAQLPNGYEGTPAGDAGYAYLGMGEIETTKAKTIGASYTLDSSDTVTPPDSLGAMTVNGETFALLGEGQNPQPGTYAVDWTGLVCSDGYSIDGQSYSSGNPFWHINGDATLYVGATFMLQDAGETAFLQQGNQQVLQIGEAATAPSLPETKTVGGVEYIFDGWYTDEACADQSVSPNEVSKTTTFYARYVEKAILTYDANAYDGDGNSEYDEVEGVPDPTPYKVGENVTVVAPQRPGYAFNGWNTEADGSGTPYAAGSSVAVPAGGITLYAQWAHSQVNVTYYRNNNNGDNTVLNQETVDTDSQGTIWEVLTLNGYICVHAVVHPYAPGSMTMTSSE